MPSVKGYFDGNVVVLREPAPVVGESEVEVSFPELPKRGNADAPRKFHWAASQELLTVPDERVSDALREQRQAV